MSRRPGISVLLVTHDSRARLADCLAALPAAAGGRRCEVIAVDNGSADGSAAWLARWCRGGESRRLLTNRENQGLARATNQALALAREPYLAVLNPDVVAGPGSLARLASALEAEPEVGLVLPRLVDRTGALQPSCRTFYTLGTVVARRAPVLGSRLAGGALVRRHLMLDWDHAEPRDVDWGQGAAFLLRRVALPRPDQLYDPRYFLYFEDVDLAWTLWDRGWRVRYLPQAAMVHHEHRASADLRSRTAVWHLRSGLRFWLKTRGRRPRGRAARP